MAIQVKTMQTIPNALILQAAYVNGQIEYLQLALKRVSQHPDFKTYRSAPEFSRRLIRALADTKFSSLKDALAKLQQLASEPGAYDQGLSWIICQLRQTLSGDDNRCMDEGLPIIRAQLMKWLSARLSLCHGEDEYLRRVMTMFTMEPEVRKLATEFVEKYLRDYGVPFNNTMVRVAADMLINQCTIHAHDFMRQMCNELGPSKSIRLNCNKNFVK